MKAVKFAFVVFFLTFSVGCAQFLFDSDRQDHSRIHKMSLFFDNPIQVSNVSQTPDPENFPDVSPDGQKYVFISKLALGQEQITIRNMGETGITPIYSSNNKLIWPRWSCQQDFIAFAEFTNNQAKIFTVATGPGGTPNQVTTPGTNQSDSGGHDIFEGGNKIVFARSNSTGGTWDLYYAPYDGSGSAQAITPTSFVNELLPVVSHDGNRLAYLSYIPLAPGWMELITIVEIGSWTPVKLITLQPPLGGRKIGAIAFTHNDQGLYVATKSADVSATPDTKKYEIFLVKGIGPDQDVDIKRLTTNDAMDHHPSAIPADSYANCQRCIDVQSSPAIPHSPEFTLHRVLIKAATLPNGNSSYVSVEDYSSPPDGINEIKIPWSETDTGAAEFASINFPVQFFGDGPTEVEVTAFHYHSMRLQAYDINGNLLSSADHTAGQRVSQTLTLDGGNISKITITGAEIGINDICYRR